MTIAPTPCFSAYAGVNTHLLTLLCYHLPFRRKFALSPNGSGSPPAAAVVVVLGPVGTQHSQCISSVPQRSGSQSSRSALLHLQSVYLP
ncbi:hypothetical protein LSAT2_007142 [Lamellibrachia satsuma]|nr:hypothetical protein LSAT2_007142 [Lamellibrachia satsuma]